MANSLGFSFSHPDLLAQALVHSSYANEHPKEGLQHNERLEFLGDAVLDLVVSDWLYHLDPAMDEGIMTRVRASIVCERSLAATAQHFHLGEHLLMGCGELGQSGRCRASILADTFEALVGAVFLDSGIEAVYRFVESTLGDTLRLAQQGLLLRDYKSQLQEELQKEGPRTIAYELLHESGPAHDRFFEVAVQAEGVVLGRGTGNSKKAAEQQAAKAGLESLYSGRETSTEVKG